MKHQKILNLLNKFYQIICDQNMEHCQWSSIKQKLWCKKWNFYSTEVLKSDLCDYNDSYILGRGENTVLAGPATEVTFLKIKHYSLSVPQKQME